MHVARPSIPEDQKRKQIAVRLGPEARRRFQALAKEHGQSLGAEVEQLALAHLALVERCDDSTLSLLQNIVEEIAEIERTTGKRWHRDRTTWAAVAEMLKIGPIQRHESDPPSDDDELMGNLLQLHKIRLEKDEIAKKLRDLRISVTPEHPLETAAREIGPFGETKVSKEEAYAIRHTEAVAVALLRGPKADIALKLFERLVELDEEELEAEVRWSRSRNLYQDAEELGRLKYRGMLKERAHRRREAGETFEPRHLFGRFD